MLVSVEDSHKLKSLHDDDEHEVSVNIVHLFGLFFRFVRINTSQERRNYTNRVSFCTIMATSVGENEGHKRANFRPKNDTGTKIFNAKLFCTL